VPWILAAQDSGLRTEDGVAAFSRRCTDLGCLVSWNKERSQFICPAIREPSTAPV
jgi:Rieske Fe-S protein